MSGSNSSSGRDSCNGNSGSGSGRGGKLEGKVAVVSGAGGGMGRVIAQTLAEEGARLVLCDVADISRRMADVWPAALEAPFIRAIDIADRGRVSSLYAEVERAFGRADIVVNCAAVWDEAEADEIDDARWQRMIDINLKGTFCMCQGALPLMRARGGGAIVNFASTAGEYGSIRPAAHYAASKGGVIAMSKSLAREGAEHRIRVNVISPGPTDTPMLNVQNDRQRTEFGARTLLGRVGTPLDMAKAALFLVSDDSSWITGEVLRVNGGSLI